MSVFFHIKKGGEIMEIRIYEERENVMGTINDLEEIDFNHPIDRNCLINEIADIIKQNVNTYLN